jgi:hypothetical protein
MSGHHSPCRGFWWHGWLRWGWQNACCSQPLQFSLCSAWLLKKSLFRVQVTVSHRDQASPVRWLGRQEREIYRLPLPAAKASILLTGQSQAGHRV